MTERTERGFRIFHDGDDVQVVESSLAFEGPHVRVYGGRDPDDHVHLSLPQVRSVVAALVAFAAEAEAGKLTEKPEGDE